MARTKKTDTPRISRQAEADAQTAASIMRTFTPNLRREALRILQGVFRSHPEYRIADRPITAPVAIPGLLSPRAVALLRAVPPSHIASVLRIAMAFADPEANYITKDGKHFKSIHPYLLPKQAAATARFRRTSAAHIAAHLDREMAAPAGGKKKARRG